MSRDGPHGFEVKVDECNDGDNVIDRFDQVVVGGGRDDVLMS